MKTAIAAAVLFWLVVACAAAPLKNASCEVDSDKDGTPDCIDNCPTSTIKTDPGVCGCNVPDVDEDGDGYYACEETCDNNPNMQEPGVCGCFDAIDTDGDGTPDCIDLCPNDPEKLAPGVCGCGFPDVDSDGDSVLDCNDTCPLNPYLQYDTGDCGTCDQMYVICSSEIQGCYPFCYNDPLNYPDPCTFALNRCPHDSRPKLMSVLVPPPQLLADCATTDSDGDGVSDCWDKCPNDPRKAFPSACGCGVEEADTDGDGVPDCLDQCPFDPNKTTRRSCGCGVPETDSDGDGTADCWDRCPHNPEKQVEGWCGCETPEGAC